MSFSFWCKIVNSKVRSKQTLLFYTQGTQRRVNVHGTAQQLADHLFESNLFAVGFQNLLISKNVKNTGRFKLLSCQNLLSEMKSLLFVGLFSWRERKLMKLLWAPGNCSLWYFKWLNYQSDKKKKIYLEIHLLKIKSMFDYFK